jgi:ferric-dicitrate binding protein FerR (iron transport regulator)
MVELSGEAYFEVAHDPSHPFRVVTKKQTIEVLGTHFNINAYENELSTKTTLLQGAVRISANGRFKILKPGQQAAVNANEIELTDADPQEAIAWKDGFFEFTDADIETIMRQISRWYDVDVTYEGKITKETFTGRVSKFLSIKQVLALVQSPEVHITYEGRRVMVKN